MCIKTQPTHPLADPNTLIFNIAEEEDEILMRIINVYHEKPALGHNLQHLFDHDLDELTPTLLVGDFNTHALWWSLPGKAPSVWASDFTTWLDTHNLTIHNPPNQPTWQGNRDGDQALVLDLVISNKAAATDYRLSEAEISFPDSLSSDHAVISILIYPSLSIALQPPPQPTRYNTDDKLKQPWIKAFRLALGPSDAATVLSMGAAPAHKAEPPRGGDDATKQPAALDSGTGPGLEPPWQTRSYLAVEIFDRAIQVANHTTLKPKHVPNPKSPQWWDNNCTAAYNLVRTVNSRRECQTVVKVLQRTIAVAKREWAHGVLHDAQDARDLWHHVGLL